MSSTVVLTKAQTRDVVALSRDYTARRRAQLRNQALARIALVTSLAANVASLLAWGLS